MANHLKSKRALSLQNTSNVIHQFESLKFEEYCDDNIRSNMGRYYLVLTALMIQAFTLLLDTGGNNTYVNDRRLITNVTSDFSSKSKSRMDLAILL